MLQKLLQILLKYNKYIVALVTLLLIYLLTIHRTDINHVAITRNYLSGEIKLDSTAGYSLTYPWVQVVKIDIRPIRVCIPSTNRNINCRLVQFNSKHWKEFVRIEGVRYYWFDNRISFNSGYNDEYRGFKDLIRGYSFDNNDQYKFVKIIEEIK